MDAAETAALVKLGERKVWGVDQLPPEIDADILRGLDSEGVIHARFVVMQNCQSAPGAAMRWQPQPGEWVSPMRNPTHMGGWDKVLKRAARGTADHPNEVCVSEKGLAEIARIKRATYSSPGAVGTLIESLIQQLAAAEHLRLVEQERAAGLRSPDEQASSANMSELARARTAVAIGAGPLVIVAHGLGIDASPLDAFIRTGDPRSVEGAIRVLRLVQAACSRASMSSAQGGTKPTQTEALHVQPVPQQLATAADLSPGEQLVWDFLKAAVLTAAQLADPNRVNTSEQTVKEHVMSIRQKRGTGVILTKPGRGYWRPDAPPNWDDFPPVRKRRVRPR